jgi:hypothetical protein
MRKSLLVYVFSRLGYAIGLQDDSMEGTDVSTGANEGCDLLAVAVVQFVAG